MKGIGFMSAAAFFWAALSGTSYAQGAAFDLPLASSVYIKDYDSFRLAAADDAEVGGQKPNGIAAAAPKKHFEPSLITPSKVHEYLGLGTIVLAGLTAITAPGDGCENNCTAQSGPRQTNGTHAKLAKATVAMAETAILTGLIVHWDDFHLADGIMDPDNLHILLAATGAGLMAWAVNRSKSSAVPISHAGIAELGALGMVAAIKITW
jgi:hypothetical protein